MKTEIRAVVLGHLTITMPAIVITAATVRFLLYTYGPMQMVYFILTGVALSWQWYVMALARWKESLTNQGFQGDEIEKLAAPRRAILARRVEHRRVCTPYGCSRLVCGQVRSVAGVSLVRMGCFPSSEFRLPFMELTTTYSTWR